MKLEDLNECYSVASLVDANYVAVRVRIGSEETSEEEVIINSRKNFSSKKAYYNRTYDENLQHKISIVPIFITGFAHGDSYAEIEEKLGLKPLSLERQIKQNY
ncbi:hypothetical protein CN984_12190 [Bacillus cereus]|uniref:Uncharacterized protein n=1 Tax=Bacillus cereus TaxID=1396 RepID=A0A2A7FNJ6_BACCE|nr:hypothetical protein [Bacillus cereus]PEA25822.1 hypothetical protein CON44_17905 [Bacillus cereus]PGO29197.1 hypothetical protein CN984_12190 [Bacillus cereus]